MSDLTVTPGGNPVCPKCGNWYLGNHECADSLMHWVPNEGATHAVVNVQSFHGTSKTEDVTCPICIGHIKERT